MEDVKDIYQKKLDEITKEMKELGIEMGWMTETQEDPDGMFGPMIREMFGEAGELELKRLNTGQDAGKALKFLKLFRVWEHLTKIMNEKTADIE